MEAGQLEGAFAEVGGKAPLSVQGSEVGSAAAGVDVVMLEEGTPDEDNTVFNEDSVEGPLVNCVPC